MAGLAMAPMIASVASVALSASDSNHRSRTVRAGPVRISTASEAAGPSLRNARPSESRFQMSPGPGERTSGGVMVSVGSITSATRSSIAS
jgi:hypothetical protein